LVPLDGSRITVMMPKIARKTLGLADGTFSTISIENHGLTFRGDGVTKPVELPVSMVGTYHGDILNNLFLYFSNNRQNGILGVTTGPLTKVIFFKQGHIVFGGSTDATERIGNVLLRLGLVTPEEIRRVEENPDPRRFGVRLKEMGFLTHDELWEGLRAQITRICCSLVDFPVGSYFFLPNSVPLELFNHFFIEPTEILFQGMIEMDERQRDLGVAPAYGAERSPLEVLADMERD
jgi:hypothetical protein